MRGIPISLLLTALATASLTLSDDERQVQPRLYQRGAFYGVHLADLGLVGDGALDGSVTPAAAATLARKCCNICRSLS